MHDQQSKSSEFNFTSESASDDRFDELIEKIRTAGGIIVSDHSAPLFYDTGKEEVEIGERRVVEFELKERDFLILREVKRRRILGGGNKRLAEDLPKSIVEMKLKSRNKGSDNWVFIDLEDLF